MRDVGHRLLASSGTENDRRLDQPVTRFPLSSFEAIITRPEVDESLAWTAGYDALASKPIKSSLQERQRALGGR